MGKIAKLAERGKTMYIVQPRKGYDSGGQFSRRAWFLILAQPSDEKPCRNNVRAFVRKVSLSQFGHFMMGIARIHGYSIVVSGAYGNDGLPKTMMRSLWEKGAPLPDELYDAWASGNGWNNARSEWMSMVEWACENFTMLAPKGASLH